MPRNIEVKARVPDLDALVVRTTSIADSGPTVILQDDTFFSCANGRLKLRAFQDGTGELIFYQRSDQSGPKLSNYVLSPIGAPDSLREALTLAYGQAGRVVKRRTLFLVGRTRVHLDQVVGLGDFMELEVVLSEHEIPEAGMREARNLMESLGIAQDSLVDGAYVDLLRKRAATT